MQKRWLIQPQLTDDTREQFPDLDPILLQLLVNRGLTETAVMREFLLPKYDEHLADGSRFRDMEKAVSRLRRALKDGESIALFGDYDVDGVSAVAVFALALRAVGAHNVETYIPDRYEEGYGLNKEAIQRLRDNGATLLLACDCGTSQREEIALADSLGMNVIVVDHHQPPPELPDAYAFLNPAFPEETYPTKNLCSTGVAWKVVQQLLRACQYGEGFIETPLPEGWEKILLDLVAVATVADMVPLVGENRTLTKYGLIMLKKGRRVGFRALAEVMRTPLSAVTAQTISFQIAPRLNAAGRLKHARSALTLLLTDSLDEARTIAAELNTTNQERQVVTDKLYQEALAQVPADPPLMVVAHGEGWTSGVIGLVAGKLKEAFYRPALAIGREGEKIVGSGRSIAGFDITKALHEARDYLARFGGHPMACGFTVQSAQALPSFVKVMQDIAARDLAQKDLTPEVTIDTTVPLRRIDWQLRLLIDQCAPFGAGSAEPTFATLNVELLDSTRVGPEGKHLRVHVRDRDGRDVMAIGFRMGERQDQFHIGQFIDCAYHVTERFWNGQRELTLQLVDLRPNKPTV